MKGYCTEFNHDVTDFSCHDCFHLDGLGACEYYEPKPEEAHADEQISSVRRSSSESYKLYLDSPTMGTDIMWLFDFNEGDPTYNIFAECETCHKTVFYVKRETGEMECKNCGKKHRKKMSLNFA